MGCPFAPSLAGPDGNVIFAMGGLDIKGLHEGVNQGDRSHEQPPYRLGVEGIS